MISLNRRIDQVWQQCRWYDLSIAMFFIGLVFINHNRRREKFPRNVEPKKFQRMRACATNFHGSAPAFHRAA